MSSLRLILASFLFHWRTHAAVACGVAVATAVLTGALLVGDSMRGSLRDLALEQLGSIDEALVAQGTFRAALADELAESPGFAEHFAAAVPAFLLEASLANADPQAAARANRVQLIGGDARFLALGEGGPAAPPSRRGIVLTAPLAEMLQLAQGDAVIVRLPRPGTIPAETPLGRTRETVDSHRLLVEDIIPASGLGRFSLSLSQHVPRNAFVSLEWLQEALDAPGEANALFVAQRGAEWQRQRREQDKETGKRGEGETPDSSVLPEAGAVAQAMLRPRLADYGVRVERTERGYLAISTQRMLFDADLERALLDGLAAEGLAVQTSLTYLANTLAAGEEEIPYSTVAAASLEGPPPLGPFLSPEGEPVATPGEGEIVLNAWAAEDLEVQVGDRIRLDYFAPESPHGDPEEHSIDLRLSGIVALEGPAADPAFTPSVPGVTDQLTMADWDAPFPFDARRIRPQDDDYWEAHRGTPKAFVAPQLGRRLWESRFGRTTLIHVVGEEWTADGLAAALAGRLEPAELGLAFRPVREEALAAAAGTTPFDVLFLAFSMFLIAAAVMLVALLFRLGIERRGGQIGILQAVGLRRGTIARLLIAEGLLVAIAGTLLGVPAAVAYAAAMVHGMRTIWVTAVVTPFLELHVTTLSLLLGAISSAAIAAVVIALSVRRVTAAASTRGLLVGGASAPLPAKGTGRAAKLLPPLALLAAAAVGIGAVGLGEEARAGAFFASGMLVLAAGLGETWRRLAAGQTGAAVAAGRANVARLAFRNAARNPSRSTLTMGLVASACFVLAAVSAFRIDTERREPQRHSGDGGFALVAESDQPLYHDFATPAGRAELAIIGDDAKVLEETATMMLRLQPGDDASCLNLYRARQPRVLGVPAAMIERGGFAWAAAAAETAAEEENPWLLLHRELEPDAGGVPRVPAVLDYDTATYALHLFGGLGETLEIRDGRGRPLRLVVVGLLQRSVLQGEVLIAEEAFLQHFPDAAGYRFFLIEAPPDHAETVRSVLETRLGDFGLVAETTGERLAGFLAVQNTYLSTFQTLGGLGLLLGTFGLAAVQLRNVFERRRELALLRAAGMTRAMIGRLVFWENSLLLLGGIACGLAAAAVAVLPHLLFGTAAVPWLSLALLFLLVLAAGLIAGTIAVRNAVAAPLVATLRSE